MMKMLSSMFVVLLLVISFIPEYTFAADKQQFCNNYADTAVKQYNLGKQHNLPGIVPPSWSNDRNGHYNWCILMPENVVSNETTKRQAYLDKNIPKKKGATQFATGAVIGTMLELPKIMTVPGTVLGETSYLGCFKDSNNRDLSGFSFSSPKMTKKLCMDTCRQKGFKYAGSQYSQQCFCGNNYGKLGKSNNCKMPCSGNKGEICGGSWANSIYQVKSANKVAGAIFNNSNMVVKLENMTDRPGKNYKNIQVRSEFGANACLDLCRQDVKCKSFTFVETNESDTHGRCYLKNEIPLPVKKKNCTSGVVRPKNKVDYCRNYASDAVQSSNINKTNGCSYSGNRWSGDYQSHLDFCMKVSIQRSQHEILERKKLLQNCNRHTISGDLSAHDMCYEISDNDSKISFYPIIKNVGPLSWRSKKEGKYLINSKVGRVIKQSFFEFGSYPSWGLNTGQTYKLGGVTFPFSPKNTYRVGWTFWHDEDINSSNNGMAKPFSTFGLLSGKQLIEHPWLLSHKACSKAPMKYWPLNLRYTNRDLNNIPLNPKFEWQAHHSFGSPDYYPDIPWLIPLLEVRTIDYVLGIAKIGEERDFSKATNQPYDTEYGQISTLPFKCGPHVNWKIPVTYEGYLKAGNLDLNDGDLNFYLYTPEGAGAIKSKNHEGGIKIEFNTSETTCHFTTPWWLKIQKIWGIQPGEEYTPVEHRRRLLKQYLDTAINKRYAIVTALWGYDCAHECDSELHPAWTMAIRVKDDPGDDIYAIFARKLGDEGYCSEHLFSLPLPKYGNQYIYKFLLPWRPGAKSVETDNSSFLQQGGVTLDVTPVPQKGVVVTFGFPLSVKEPRINGELHLRWSYPPGMSPKPYPIIKTAITNASKASEQVVLEDTEMNEKIMKILPMDKKRMYGDIIKATGMRELKSIPDRDQPEPLRINVRAMERINTEILQIDAIEDVVKIDRKRGILKKYKIEAIPPDQE